MRDDEQFQCQERVRQRVLEAAENFPDIVGAPPGEDALQNLLDSRGGLSSADPPRHVEPTFRCGSCAGQLSACEARDVHSTLQRCIFSTTIHATVLQKANVLELSDAVGCNGGDGGKPGTKTLGTHGPDHTRTGSNCTGGRMPLRAHLGKRWRWLCLGRQRTGHPKQWRRSAFTTMVHVRPTEISDATRCTIACSGVSFRRFCDPEAPKTMRKLSRTRSTTAMGTDGICARAAEEL